MFLYWRKWNKVVGNEIFSDTLLSCCSSKVFHTILDKGMGFAEQQKVWHIQYFCIVTKHMKLCCTSTISVGKIEDYGRLSILKTWSYFAITTSLLAKWVNPDFISFHCLSSKAWLLLNPSCKSGIGIKPTTVSSEIMFLGLIVNKEPILTHSHVSGISNGISLSIQRSIPSNFS